jgi:hypothetical protein
MLGTDHKSLLLARIFDGKSRQTKVDTSHMPEAVKEAVDRQLATFALRYQKALVVTLNDILSVADKANELITVEEVGEWAAEPPRNHLYKSHKTPTDEQVAALLTANGPPAPQIFKLDAGRKLAQEVNSS